MKKIIIIDSDRDLLGKLVKSLELLNKDYYVIGVSNDKELSSRANLEKGDKLLIRLKMKKGDLSIDLINRIIRQMKVKKNLIFYEDQKNLSLIKESILEKIKLKGFFFTFIPEDLNPFIRKIIKPF